MKHQNKEWLYQHYVIEDMKIADIAQLANVCVSTIKRELKQNDIPIIRDIKSKYPELNNKEWLYQKYIVEKLSTRDITKLIGAKTCNSVRQHLIKFGIPVRNYLESREYSKQYIQFNSGDDGLVINKSVLEGCLLGDGYFNIYNKFSDISNPRFIRHNMHYEHVKYIYDLLQLKNIKITHENNSGQGCYRFVTYSHSELKEYYKNWYPESSGYKKVIPKNINIDEIVLLHWWLDDGWSHYRNRTKEYNRTNWKQNKKQVIVGLCSQSFIKEDQEWICEQFNNKFDLGMNLKKVKTGTGWIINIPQSKSDHFFEVIGECPLECFQYKWK